MQWGLCVKNHFEKVGSRKEIEKQVPTLLVCSAGASTMDRLQLLVSIQQQSCHFKIHRGIKCQSECCVSPPKRRHACTAKRTNELGLVTRRRRTRQSVPTNHPSSNKLQELSQGMHFVANQYMASPLHALTLAVSLLKPSRRSIDWVNTLLKTPTASPTRTLVKYISVALPLKLVWRRARRQSKYTAFVRRSNAWPTQAVAGSSYSSSWRKIPSDFWYRAALTNLGKIQ